MLARLFSTSTAVLLILLAAMPAGSAGPADCAIFLLKRDHGHIVLERVPVPSGETLVVPADPASGVIGVVFPPGPGVSGSVEQPRDGRMMVLRCTEDRLRCEVRADGKTASGYPERSAADLSLCDTRVSVGVVLTRPVPTSGSRHPAGPVATANRRWRRHPTTPASVESDAGTTSLTPCAPRSRGLDQRDRCTPPRCRHGH